MRHDAVLLVVGGGVVYDCSCLLFLVMMNVGFVHVVMPLIDDCIPLENVLRCYISSFLVSTKMLIII